MSELTTDGKIHCCTSPRTMLVPTRTSSARRSRKLGGGEEESIEEEPAAEETSGATLLSLDKASRKKT